MANNIIITPGSASIQFSGSANNDTIRLQVEPSGAVAFYGNSGSLFSISDSLSGSLMSVNDVSGLPILEVFSDDRVVLGTYNRNTLVVTGSRVGIDKAIPTADLDVSGSVFITGSLRVTSEISASAFSGSGVNITGIVSSSFATSASWAPGGSGLSGGTANYIPLWSSATAQSSSNIFQSANNIGIGTTIPTSYGKFSVLNLSETNIRFMHSNNAGGETVNLTMGSSNTSFLSSHIFIKAIKGAGIDRYTMNLGTATSDPIIFSTNNTERMRLTTDGNLGINFPLGPSSTTRLYISGSDDQVLLRAVSPSSLSVLIVSGSGNVGIGITNPANKLQVQGNVSASSYTSSLSNQVGYFGTASFAVSASWAPGGSTGNTFPFTGSADISGSLSINTTGTKALFSTYMEPGYTGENLWIGGGGQNVVSSDGIEGNFNTSVGIGALSASTSGYSNTAVGTAALQKNTTGTANVAVGDYSLYEVTLGTNNVAVGSNALSAMKEYDGNTAVGYFGLLGLLTGSNNTTLGSLTGDSLTDGSRNTFIGSSAGTDITSGSNNTILGRFSGNQNGLNITTANNYIVLSDGDGNPRIVVNNTGNVGIGNVAPVNKLQVQGNVSASSYTSSLNNAVGYFGTASFAVSASWAPGGGTSATSSYALVAEAVRILSGSPDPLQSQYTGSFTGSFIGNTVVSGSLTATGIISAAEFNTTSDINKKDNVVLIQDALSLVNNMRGVTFTWKDTQQPSAGVIAQDIQQILPQLVHTKSDGYLSVNYDGLIGVLIEAIKQLQQEVEELKRDAI